MAVGNTLIEQLHASPWQGVIATSGGGSSLVSQLCATGGASGTILEAITPYAKAALIDYIGNKPTGFCSEEAARAMAMRSFQRALQLQGKKQAEHLFGLGCAASLASVKPKSGTHRVHIALQTLTTTAVCNLLLAKGERSRVEEEELITLLCLNLLAQYMDLPVPKLSLLSSEVIARKEDTGLPAWCGLLTGTAQAVSRFGNLLLPAKHPNGHLLFPGAFNPLHSGHMNMVKHAESMLNRRVEFEMCIDNPDKVILDYHELKLRLIPFPQAAEVWLTTTPTFVQKCQIFPNTTFMVGVDTVLRVQDPSYYVEGQDLGNIFYEMNKLSCSFLVYGRYTSDGFRTLYDVDVVPALAKLCYPVSEAEFRQDLSSSSIRSQPGQEG